MTDNEIIKALPKIWYGGHGCKKCKFANMRGDERCGLKGCYIARQALDLINRLKAENKKNENIIRLADKTIETQNAEIERLNNHFRDLTKKVKSEARKEFAERLKEKAFDCGISDNSGNNYGGATVILYQDLDNLLKEMG